MRQRGSVDRCGEEEPESEVIGIDRWGKEYASFSRPLCEKNAKAEGVSNVSFQQTYRIIPVFVSLSLSGDIDI